VKIRAENPDVIISDIGLLRMDSYQLKQKLQDLPRYSATPFLFVSALAYLEATDKGLSIGADHYLTKPVNFDALLSRIETGGA